MKKKTLHFGQKGFTLIELIVAVVILSIIMLSVFVIYSNLVSVNRKLEQTRVLQEQTRLITETIAADVRASGIDFAESAIQGTLRTRSGNLYTLQQKIGNVYGGCDSSETKVPCQLMSEFDKPITSDAVDVRDVKFIITGSSNKDSTNEDVEGKVQMMFRIGIAPKKGVSLEVIKASFIDVQTTISEKIYKEN